MNPEMIDQPLDIDCVLHQVSSNLPEAVPGMIDANHARAIRCPSGSYKGLTLSGAHIDPSHFLALCPSPDAKTWAIPSDLEDLDIEETATTSLTTGAIARYGARMEQVSTIPPLRLSQSIRWFDILKDIVFNP